MWYQKWEIRGYASLQPFIVIEKKRIKAVWPIPCAGCVLTS